MVKLHDPRRQRFINLIKSAAERLAEYWYDHPTERVTVQLSDDEGNDPRVILMTCQFAEEVPDSAIIQDAGLVTPEELDEMDD